MRWLAILVALATVLVLSTKAFAVAPYGNAKTDPIVRWLGNPSIHYKPTVQKGWTLKCDTWLFTTKGDPNRKINLTRCYETKLSSTAA